MANLSEQQFKQHIKSGEFSNAYLIYGEESYLKNHYLSLMKNKIISPDFESFNFHKFDGSDISLDDVSRDAQMLPFMSEYNFILVSDFHFEKFKEIGKVLKSFLSDIPQSTIVVFFYNSYNPNELPSFKKVISAFGKYGCVVNLEKRSEGDVAKLLVSRASKRGSLLDINNAKYLISVVGNDINALSNELDKLIGFVNGGEITKNIIDSMATKSLQARVYDLSKAIVSGNADKAYRILDTLLDMKENPILILSVIGNNYVDMYRVKCAKTAGLAYGKVAEDFNYGTREFVLRYASSDCARLSNQQLRNSLDIIIDTDVMLKSTAVDKRILLEQLIAKLLLTAEGVHYAQN